MKQICTVLLFYVDSNLRQSPGSAVMYRSTWPSDSAGPLLVTRSDQLLGQIVCRSCAHLGDRSWLQFSSRPHHAPAPSPRPHTRRAPPRRRVLRAVGLGLAVVAAEVCVEVPVAALLVPANSPHLLDTIPDHDITTLMAVVGRADRHVSASGDLEVELSTNIIGKFIINI